MKKSVRMWGVFSKEGAPSQPPSVIYRLKYVTKAYADDYTRHLDEGDFIIRPVTVSWEDKRGVQGSGAPRKEAKK